MKNTLKQQAIPNQSMFSCNTETKELEFVATVFFDKSEIIGGTVKYYAIPKEEGKVYLQAESPDMARKKFESFFNYKSQNEKSNIEAKSS